jgi:hypothetical protein
MFRRTYHLHLRNFYPEDGAISSSETLVTTYKTKWRQNEAAHNSNFHRRDNLKPHYGCLHLDIIISHFADQTQRVFNKEA